MNRSLVANWVLLTLAAASMACGSANDTKSTNQPSAAAAESAPGQARLASRLVGPAEATTHPPSRRARAALARKMAASAVVANAAIPPKYQAFAAAFDLDARQSNAAGAAVALVEHGAVTFTHGFGTASVGGTAPVDGDTIFRVGTLTEPMTAAAALALIDAGKGSLDEPITTAVPGVSLSGPNASSLTTRNLLANKSGLLDFTSWGSDPNLLTSSCDTDPTTLQSFVTGPVLAQDAIFMTPPGVIYTASNASFIFAGAAIEKHAGALFTDAMKSVLFTPLGMNRTFFLPSDVASAGNYATGTGFDTNNNPVPLADYDCAAYRPFGYAFSSVSDYAKFIQLLLNRNPKVLSDASLLAMESVQAETRDLGHIANQGYGLSVSSGYVTQANAYHRTTTLSANGGFFTPGFSSIFYAFPETGFGIVVLSNMPPAQFVDSIDVAVKSFAGLPPASPLPRRTYAVPSKFSRYAGTYTEDTGNFGTIIVSDQGGALSVNIPAAPPIANAYWPQLSPVLDDSFLLPLFGFPNVVQFRDDGPSGYRYLVVDDEVVLERVTPDGGP